jgi:hypothetical protein
LFLSGLWRRVRGKFTIVDQGVVCESRIFPPLILVGTQASEEAEENGDQQPTFICIEASVSYPMGPGANVDRPSTSHENTMQYAAMCRGHDVTLSASEHGFIGIRDEYGSDA